MLFRSAKERSAPLIIAKPSKRPRKLLGDYQNINVGIVLEVVKILIDKYPVSITEQSIDDGLMNVSWPGRMDFIAPNILVDVAHNPNGVTALSNELKKLDYSRLILVTGILRDKDYEQMLSMLLPLASKVIFCAPKTDRAISPNYLTSIFNHPNMEIVLNVDEAFEKGKSLLKEGDLLLVTGSLYTAGEVYAHLQKQSRTN